MRTKNKRIKRTIFLMAVMAFTAVLCLFSGKLESAVAVPAPESAGEPAHVVTRTFGLDLTAGSVKYITKGGYFKTANPLTDNITDTEEGWAWYRNTTTVGDVTYPDQTLVLSGINFQIDKPFTAVFMQVIETYPSAYTRYNVTGGALRMPLTENESDARIILTEGTVNTINALDAVNEVINVDKPGVPQRTKFNFYTVNLTCEIIGNGMLVTQGLDWYIGGSNTDDQYNVAFGDDESSPTVNVLHGRIFIHQGNLNMKGGMLNVVNDTMTGVRRRGDGELLTAAEIIAYELNAIHIMNDGTIYNNDNTKLYASGKAYGLSFNYEKYNLNQLSKNAVAAFQGGKRAVQYLAIGGQIPVEGGISGQKAVYAKSKDEYRAVAFENAGYEAYGFGYYYTADTVEVYAGTKYGYVFDRWTVKQGSGSFLNAYDARTPFAISNEDKREIILVPVWRPAGYSINYELNGGEFSLPYASKYYYGNVTDLPIPTWGDYTFEGWYEDALLRFDPTSQILARDRDYGNKTFYAKWKEVDPYIITVYPPKNGGKLLSRQYGTVIYPGTSIDFVLIPDSGYKIAYFKVGTSEDSLEEKKLDIVDNVFTLSNVTENMFISAEYEEITPEDITVQAYSGENGRICPNNYMVVPSGGSATYKITPDIGFRISDVKVNGVSIGAVSSYTFENVTSYQSIGVEFEDATQTLILNPNGGTVVQGNTLPTYYTEGEEFVLPDSTQIQKAKHSFSGWFDNAGLTGAAVTHILSSESGAKQYRAKWTENVIEGITASDISQTYDGTPYSVTVSGLIAGDTVSYKTTGNYSSTNPTFTQVTDTTVYYKVERANHADFEGSAQIAITPATLTNVSVTDYSGTYDETAHFVVASKTAESKNSQPITWQYKLTEGGTYGQTQPQISDAVSNRIVYYKVSAPNHADYEGTFTVTIYPIDISGATVVLGPTPTYNGYVQTQTVEKITFPDGGYLNWSFNITGNEERDYSPEGYILTVTGTANYSGSVTAKWNIAKAALTNISAPDYSGTYNRSAHDTTGAHTATSQGSQAISWQYKLSENDEYTSGIPTFIDAVSSNQRVYYKISASNHIDSTGSFTVSIARLSISGATVTLGAGLTYNGAMQTQTVSAVKIGALIVPMDSIEVTGNTQTNCSGSGYELTITGNGNYSGTVTKSWNIDKAQFTNVSVTGYTGIYDGEGHDAVVSKTATSVGGQLISWEYKLPTSDSSFSTDMLVFTDAIQTTVNYKISAPNHYDKHLSFTVLIARKSLIGANVTLGPALTFNNSEQIQTVAEVTLDGKIVTASNLYITQTMQRNHSESGYILKVSGIRNYVDTVDVPWNIAKADLTNVSATGYSGIYDGAAHDAVVAKSATPIGAPTLTWQYRLSDDEDFTSDVPTFTDAVSAQTVYYKVSAPNHKEFVGSFTVTISPKDISGATVTLGAALTYNGAVQTQTVSTVILGGITVPAASISVTDNIRKDWKQGGYELTITGIGNYIGTITISWNIAKADYDVSAITFNGNTVKYDGTTHSLFVEGNLPEGLSVSYENNGKTDYGVYTVTAIFTGTTNYNTIENKSAVLKILADKFSASVKDNTSEIADTIIYNDNGFEPDIEFVVTIIPNTNVVLHSSELDSVIKVYNISLYREGRYFALDNLMTVKLLIPSVLENTGFRIYNRGESLVYTIDGDYVVFTVDTLGEFIIVSESSQGSIVWLVGLLLVLLSAEITLIAVNLFKRMAKKQKDTQLNSFGFLLLAAAMPGGQVAAVTVLSLLCIGGAIVNVFLYLPKLSKMLAYITHKQVGNEAAFDNQALVLSNPFEIEKKDLDENNCLIHDFEEMTDDVEIDDKEEEVFKGIEKETGLAELISKETYENFLRRQNELEINNKKRTVISAGEADKILQDEQAAMFIIKKKRAAVIQKKEKDIVNIDTISAKFSANDTVSLKALKEKTLIDKDVNYIKILARGALDKPLTIEANDFSIEAVKMIVLTGGKVIKIT